MDGTQTGPESIGDRLRRLRLERGLSQRELASHGVSYAYISRIEAGARRPSVKALRQLARKLGVSPEYLETGSDLREVDERELRIADAELQLRLTDDPVDVVDTLRAIHDDAAAAGDATSVLRARVALGLAAARTGDNGEAIERLESAVETRLLSPARRPDVYTALGQCYAATGEPARAVALFERCIVEVREEAPEDGANHVRFATYLSYALSDVGDLGRAERVLTDALPHADEVADAYTRVRLYWSLARLNELRDQPAVALDYIRRAIALLEVTEDTLHLARAHLLCGTIMISQGKIEEAGAQYDAAEHLLGPKSAPLDLANLRTDQARRLVLLKRSAEAEALAREALDALRTDYPAEQGAALAVLAEALALRGDEGAGDAFRQAAQLLESHGHQVDLADAYRAWGRYLRAGGHESEALDVLDRAAELSSSARVSGRS
jgi:transcriptional regulator with XRE-family HTH domain